MYYKTILVPLDGSERAETILPHVENLASHKQARVVFTRVVEPTRQSFVLDPHAPPKYEYDSAQGERAQEYLTQMVARFEDKGLSAGMVLMWGPPIDGIIRAADESSADLIAMSSQGRTGLAQVVYGSVAAGVLNRVTRPLLMVHEETSAEQESNNQILVALDGSKHAEAILPHVESVAHLYEASVTLVRVVTTAYQTAVMYDVDETTANGQPKPAGEHTSVMKELSREQEAERFEQARQYLVEKREKLRAKGLDTHAVLLQGRPVESIVHVAESIDADLIAMTSHGRSGLSQVFYGSVSSGVLNRTKRPLLLVRPKL
jgi:nucleotide-binding universal stress UspA family protein